MYGHLQSLEIFIYDKVQMLIYVPWSHTEKIPRTSALLFQGLSMWWWAVLEWSVLRRSHRIMPMTVLCCIRMFFFLSEPLWMLLRAGRASRIDVCPSISLKTNKLKKLMIQPSITDRPFPTSEQRKAEWQSRVKLWRLQEEIWMYLMWVFGMNNQS